MTSVWGKGKRKSAIVRTGTPWVNARLDAIATYLRSYTIAGLHTPGRRAYIDALAGTNYRETYNESRQGSSAGLTMPDLASEEPQALLDSLTKMALETNPAFHAYIFLDRSPARSIAIQNLKTEFLGISLENALRSRPARIEIEAMCGMAWKERRAVMFLDPFGIDVGWETIEAIAKTKAIDLWLFYPIGLGGAQLTSELGSSSNPCRLHLDRFLDSDTWYNDLLTVKPEHELFQDDEAYAISRANVLGSHFERRLQSAFPVVATQPQVLCSSTRRPLYLCSFASGNEDDAANTTRMASALLRRLGKAHLEYTPERDHPT